MAELVAGDIVQYNPPPSTVVLAGKLQAGDVGIVLKVGDYNSMQHGPFVWVQFPVLAGTWVFNENRLTKVGHVDG